MSTEMIDKENVDPDEIMISTYVMEILAQKSLFSPEVKKALGSGKFDQINSDLNQAIILLDNSGLLTKKTLDALLLPDVTASVVASEMVQIAHGLENLKKLEKYGLNTEENKEEVINAGREATQTSLEIWEREKPQVRANLQNNKSQNFFTYSVGIGTRSKIKNELEEVSKQLHRPIVDDTSFKP